MKNFINIAYITKVNLANLNGGEGTGGNITPIKKINDFEGNSYSYVSGQALRRYMKTTLQQLGETITSVDEKGNPMYIQENQSTKNRFDRQMKGGKYTGEKNEDMKKVFQEYIDLDLFGYMFPKGERRRSPIKVSPMIACNILKGDTDYLTRKQLAEGVDKSANIVQTEIETLNFYRGNILIDVKAIGTDINEYTYEKMQLLSDENKDKRIKKVIEMIKKLNGGSKSARMLEDISPKFIVCVNQDTGNPFLLNTVKVDRENNINIDIILEVIKDSGIPSEDVSVGICPGIFSNERKVQEKCKYAGFEVRGINETLDLLSS